jgi:opacity protein-like surface antigen
MRYWGGFGAGFSASNYRVTTLEQRTFNVLDLLSSDKSRDLGSTGFRGDVSLGFDYVLDNLPNYPNWGGGPWTLGLQGTFGYTDNDRRTIGIPGSALFTPGGSGTDFVRLQTTWEGSIGPRLGTFFGTNNFVYVNGGLAFEEFKATINCGTGLCGQNAIPMTMLTESKLRTGTYYGGGFMMPLTRDWRIGFELRETEFGKWDVTKGNPALYQGKFEFDRLHDFSAMARLNYNFAMSNAR